MKVEMVRSERGSPDGFVTKIYQHGRVYDLPESLASVFISEGAAILHKGPPANKSAGPAPENKGGQVSEPGAGFRSAPMAGVDGRNSGKRAESQHGGRRGDTPGGRK